MEAECPKCGELTSQPLSHCGACGLSLEWLSRSLGSNLVSLEALTDAAHCLRAREKELLKHDLEAFQQAFPQVFLAVYVGVLPTSPSPPEIAFWLLNQAAFQPADATRLNERAALLVIDPVARSAGLTVGYGLEPFLPRAKLHAILRRIRTPLWHGEYVGAIQSAIKLVAGTLRKAGRRMSRQVEFPPPGSQGGFIQGSGLQSLRDSGGRKAASKARKPGPNENPLSP
jgi:uncharacterized membrane protein YgcG